MCQHASHRHPIFCIVPPYMVDEIVDKGTPQQRAAALRTKAVDTTFRALRLATQAARFAPQRHASRAPMLTPQKRRTIYTANHTQNLPGTLRDARVRPNTGFRRFAQITYDVAGRLYGLTGLERKAVYEGWAAVGIAL
jgi:hypothetical protein